MKKNKIIFLFGIAILFASQIAYGQTAGDFFNKAARSYVKTEKDQALNTVNQGLSQYPGDSKLKALKDKLEQEQEEEKQKQEQEQQEQEQQQQEQEQQDQKGEGEQSEQEQQDQNGEKTDEDKAKDSQEGDPSEQSEDTPENANDQKDANLADHKKAMEEFKEKLKAMNLTPEQAAQILENMNAAELRYIQQNRKKPTERPKKGIPDW